MESITIIGLGYIGLPTAALVASKGLKVNGVDINPSIVETISEGKVHITEPKLEPIIKDVVKNGTLKVHNKYVAGDVYLVVVPTPFKNNYEPDVSFIEAATNGIIPLLKNGDLFIIESTSPTGTTANIANLIFNQRPELKDNIYIAYCPERVLPGNVMYELECNDRVVGGIDESSTKNAVKFYKKFVKGNIHETDDKTAELCKLVENSCRDVQIAFANELSLICEKADVDVRNLIDLANKHPRINILEPGCGVGGHCIAVDPYFIMNRFPEESKLVRKARIVNNSKPSWCIDKVLKSVVEFEDIYNKKPVITLCGLSFKPNIDDLRESPAINIVEKIYNEYPQELIRIVEPNISNHNKYRLTDYKEAIEESDIVIYLVAHDEFKMSDVKVGKEIISFVRLVE